MIPGGRTVLLATVGLLAMACATQTALVDGLEAPFASPGDPVRGREVFVAREAGHCVLCHAAPGIATAGNVGPSLAGVGARLTPAQIRLRVADITRVNPRAAMPTFHRVEGMQRVAGGYRGRPVLTGRQVEDVVAWLSTLR